MKIKLLYAINNQIKASDKWHLMLWTWDGNPDLQLWMSLTMYMVSQKSSSDLKKKSTFIWFKNLFKSTAFKLLEEFNNSQIVYLLLVGMMIISFYSTSSTEVEYQGGYITSIHQTQSPEKTKDNPCEEATRRVRKEVMREMRLTTMCVLCVHTCTVS